MAGAVIHRFAYDDLRRFAVALGTAAGFVPARSAALAAHLLWFDAAGAPSLGIATLETWLTAIDERRVDPLATGRVARERSSVADLDGENSVPLLVLERAAELAVEKARDSGVGLVRVVGIEPAASAAPIAAGIAIGPMAAWVIGPGGAWSLALPTAAGLPLVVDPGLPAAAASEKPAPADAAGGRNSAQARAASSRRHDRNAAPDFPEGMRLAAEVLVPEGGWLVAALAGTGPESLSAWHERVARVRERSAVEDAGTRLHVLDPEGWEARRRRLWQEGVEVASTAWKPLVRRARGPAIEPPAPLDCELEKESIPKNR